MRYVLVAIGILFGLAAWQLNPYACCPHTVSVPCKCVICSGDNFLKTAEILPLTMLDTPDASQCAPILRAYSLSKTGFSVASESPLLLSALELDVVVQPASVRVPVQIDRLDSVAAPVPKQPPRI